MATPPPPPTPDEPTPSQAPAAAAPARRRWPRRLGWTLLALLLLVALVAAALFASLRTERGTGWVLERVPGLTIEAPRGSLLGDFSAKRLEFELGPDSRVVLEGLRWKDATLQASASRGWRWPHLHLRSLDIDVLRLQLAPQKDDAPKSPPPESLALPLRLQIDALRIGEVQAPGLEPPVRDVRARVDLGGEDGSVHRVDELALGWDRLRLQGEARIGTAAPLPVQARLALQQSGSAPPTPGSTAALPADWNATLRLDGPLARLPAEARLAAAGQSLDAKAVLTPFAEQPLQALDASFAALDLAALHSAAPATALTGSARLRLPEGAADTLPLELALQLRNAAPGRWDAQRLPLRELRLDAAGQARDPASGVTLRSFDALLGNAERPGGRVRGSGRWTPRQWNAELRIEQLEPSALDARAPAMRLSGPLSLRSAAPAQPTPALPRPGAAQPPAEPPLSQWPIDVQARLEGRLLQAGPQRDVTLALDGRYGPQELLLRRFVAHSGEARLSLQGSVTPPDPQQPMRVRLQAELARFDPLLWWPGALDASLSAGPHRLNGGADVDLLVPPRREKQPLGDWLAALQGRAALTLKDSQFAGLPLAADVQASSAPADRTLRSTGRIELAGNRLGWEGRGDPRTLAIAPGTPLAFELEAPALARLAPLLRALGQPADPPPAGSLSLRGRAEGRWPALVAQGELQGSGLRLAGLRAAKLSGRFRMGLQAGDPLELQLEGRELMLGGPVSVARLQLQGSGLQHELTLTADAPVTPPWAATKAGAAPAQPQPQPVRLQARLEGRLDVPGAATPWTELRGWSGTLRQLQLAPLATPAEPWLRVGEVQAQWQRGAEGAQGRPQALTLSPGRAEILGAAVRWDRVRWQAAAAGRPAVLDAQAELEPLLVAPLLRQFQPGFGWAGDLRVGGRLVLRSGASTEADIELVRTGGDLVVEEGTTRQALGLDELRLAATARDGLWRFTQQVSGSRLGLLRGEQTARSAPQDPWPAPEAPLEGTLTVRVADLGAWGAWLPAGWRLGGRLNIDTNIGGRFGAPEYTGVVTGQAITARNVIEGIDVREGELVVALQGPTAQILTAQARAGEGLVRVEGGARFGEDPRAELRVIAERFAVLQRVDRRVVASGQARLLLEAESIQLDGGFRVDRALIDISRSEAPALSEDVVVYRRGMDRDAASAPPPPPPQRKIAMNVRVDLGDDFRLRGRGLEARLAGELRVSAPRNQIALNGDIRVVDGTYAAYGQNLVVERGVISFTGAIENPRLDVLAIRPKLEDVRVGVQVLGTAQNPRVRLYSEPELPETEKLSLLVLGRSYSDLGQAETQLMQTAAMALLVGEGGGGPSATSRLTQALGLDTLSFGGPTEGGNLRSSVITLGKQLSDRWYLGYAHSLNATAGTWQLIYRIAERFTLRAQTGVEANALDLIWSWRW
ncbi:translocation/assembly module TamB domain-containing protein [Caldimonas tepidiphila]|uniref:translocation/assembly module TamB domain-containing protein n=1 Tax=Caldimonas tepidiphila TaxID=2315841 RepID=UPI000E5BF527|nr:translocation/assembly module TamB domain-containing protein [Caldimonas tepidiphila]